MADAPHIMIVESPYYKEIADRMIESVLIELDAVGATYERFEVPGSFELPGAIRMAIESYKYPSDRKRFDGYIALGCVIRRDNHDRGGAAARACLAMIDLKRKFNLYPR